MRASQGLETVRFGLIFAVCGVRPGFAARDPQVLLRQCVSRTGTDSGKRSEKYLAVILDRTESGP